MKKYNATHLMKWTKRPMTEKESVELLVHLDALYEALREADLAFGQMEHRKECYSAALTKAGKGK